MQIDLIRIGQKIRQGNELNEREKRIVHMPLYKLYTTKFIDERDCAAYIKEHTPKHGIL